MYELEQGLIVYYDFGLFIFINLRKGFALILKWMSLMLLVK